MIRVFYFPAYAAMLILWLLLAAVPCAADLLQEGEQALQNGDRENARLLFTRAFEAGDPAGAFGLGVLYDQGQGEGDMEQSAHWFKIAAEAGHAGAQFNLGNAYLNGKGVPRDPAEAERLWRKAAHSGFAPACYNLGTRLFGHGGSRELREEGIAWYRSAAEKGLPEAGKVLHKLGEPPDYRDIRPDPAREPARSEARLMTMDPRGVTMQLMAGDQSGAVERFITRHELTGGALRFRFLRGGKLWTALVYGWYPNQKEAMAAIAKLKPEFGKMEPWVRPLKNVQTLIREVRRHLAVTPPQVED